jgi:hypothetical protein
MELGLKVIGKKEWLEGEIKQRPEVEKMKQSMQGKSRDAQFYDRIRLGGITQNYFASLQNEIKRNIFKPLKEASTAAKINEPISETMLLNASFLIDRSKEAEFDQKVNEAHEKWKDKLHFKYSGPWPAYNFINIRLKVEEGR